MDGRPSGLRPAWTGSRDSQASFRRHSSRLEEQFTRAIVGHRRFPVPRPAKGTAALPADQAAITAPPEAREHRAAAPPGAPRAGAHPGEQVPSSTRDSGAVKCTSRRNFRIPPSSRRLGSSRNSPANGVASPWRLGRRRGYAHPDQLRAMLLSPPAGASAGPTNFAILRSRSAPVLDVHPRTPPASACGAAAPLAMSARLAFGCASPGLGPRLARHLARHRAVARVE